MAKAAGDSSPVDVVPSRANKMTDELTVTGDGLLENLADPVESYEVDFKFEVIRPPNAEMRNSGTVQRKDGGSLTTNIYRLEMRDGTTCRVMNNAGIWTIFSS
jgi:hypothetical protein